MPSLKFLLALMAAGAAFAMGLFLYARFSNRSGVPRPSSDPVLRQLRALNPQLRIEDEFTRLQVYWVQGAQSSARIMFPISEAKGARIQLRDCDLSLIPAALLYPRRKETACLEVDNDEHRLSAYYFRTRDSRQKVIDFFEAPLGPDGRLGVDERREDRTREDGSHEFLFSYFLHPGYDVEGFVGYREEKK